LEDLFDYALVEAERSVNIVLALFVAVGAVGLYLHVDGLYLLPPAAAASYFVGSMIYRAARLYSRSGVSGPYSILVFPAYALASLLGIGVFEAALRPVVSAGVAAVMAAVLAFRVYGEMRDYEVIA